MGGRITSCILGLHYDSFTHPWLLDPAETRKWVPIRQFPIGLSDQQCHRDICHPYALFYVRSPVLTASGRQSPLPDG